MEYVYFVLLLALIQYELFAFMAGKARGAHQVTAPAMVGHPNFERMVRVQQNTGEHLIAVIPAMLVFGYYVSPQWAAGLGMLFVLARLD
ncbi:MAG: MAPEG family protein, partial [Gammaproteobacteria bacterium]